jgi:hypothetical protein
MFKHAKGFRGGRPSPIKPATRKVGGSGSAGKKKGLVQRVFDDWKAKGDYETPASAASKKGKERLL